MIIEVEDRFCKAAKAFSAVLNRLQRSQRHTRVQGYRLHALAFQVRELPANVYRKMGRLQPPSRASAECAYYP